MEVGAAVWIRDPEVAWTVGTIWLIRKLEEIEGGREGEINLEVKREYDGKVLSFTIYQQNGVIQESDNIKLMNEKGTSKVDNLVNLPFLHEPAILHSLHLRFMDDNIYTYTGRILIAVNPFKLLNLYDSQTLEAYYNFGIIRTQATIEHLVVDSVPPHIYGLADVAYRSMIASMNENLTNPSTSDQTVLISGESGAGKTESTKLILRYLTTVSADTRRINTNASVMDKVLLSNPILEAFGNARTLRNDNSSRFGKFIELNFSRGGILLGGNIRTYLLEKVRLCSQQKGERNYHIFYQMAAGGEVEDKKRWSYSSPETFRYVNQGNVFSTRFIDDSVEYKTTTRALDVLNFKSSDKVSLLNFSASVLHIGQVTFTKNDRDDSCSPEKSTLANVNIAAGLLGVTPLMLVKSMTVRVINVRSESVEKLLNFVQAADARDALAKTIYSRLFTCLVTKINTEVQTSSSQSIAATIGVLDIFGFESFEKNSFEQLCINYTNETLQQQFNNYVFQEEQAEYKSEGIRWDFIEFPNNQEVLSLLEMKQKGLFALLDDECIIPKGSNEAFADKIYSTFANSKSFSATDEQKSDGSFCIHHYAGPVIYNTSGFTDKNKDGSPPDVVSLLASSSVGLLRAFAAVCDNGSVSKDWKTSPGSVVSSKSPSVSSQFIDQLHILMDKIRAANPHYIRCLKPNDSNSPDVFNPLRVTEQLRCGGVLEAVRVARSGFPFRYSHQDFFDRFKCIMNPFNPSFSKMPRFLPLNGSQSICNTMAILILDDVSSTLPGANEIKMQRRLMVVTRWRGKISASKIDPESIQIGKSKAFFRKQSYDFFEGRRSRCVYYAAVTIQSLVRGYLARRLAIRFENAAITIQKAVHSHHLRILIDKMMKLRHEAEQISSLSIAKEMETGDVNNVDSVNANDVPIGGITNGSTPDKPSQLQAQPDDIHQKEKDILVEDNEHIYDVTDGDQASSLFHEVLGYNKQVDFQNQLPQVYSPQLMLNVFGKEVRSQERSNFDEEHFSKWTNKSAAEGGIKSIILEDAMASHEPTWREKLFGNGFLFSEKLRAEKAAESLLRYVKKKAIELGITSSSSEPS